MKNIFFLIVLLQLSCSKDIFDLEDEPRFVCHVNGKKWIPSGGSIWDSPINGDYVWYLQYPCESDLRLYARKASDTAYSFEGLSLYAYWCSESPGDPLIEGEIPLLAAHFTDWEKGCRYEAMDTLKPHFIKFTKYSLDKHGRPKGSGSFEFTVFIDNGDTCSIDTIKVTKGRFNDLDFGL